jgi:hypothetical protein
LSELPCRLVVRCYRNPIGSKLDLAAVVPPPGSLAARAPPVAQLASARAPPGPRAARSVRLQVPYLAQMRRLKRPERASPLAKRTASLPAGHEFRGFAADLLPDLLRHAVADSLPLGVSAQVRALRHVSSSTWQVRDPGHGGTGSRSPGVMATLLRATNIPACGRRTPGSMADERPSLVRAAAVSSAWLHPGSTGRTHGRTWRQHQGCCGR